MPQVAGCLEIMRGLPGVAHGPAGTPAVEVEQLLGETTFANGIAKSLVIGATAWRGWHALWSFKRGRRASQRRANFLCNFNAFAFARIDNQNVLIGSCMLDTVSWAREIGLEPGLAPRVSTRKVGGIWAEGLHNAQKSRLDPPIFPMLLQGSIAAPARPQVFASFLSGSIATAILPNLIERGASISCKKKPWQRQLGYFSAARTTHTRRN
jgi:hypothetical protein